MKSTCTTKRILINVHLDVTACIRNRDRPEVGMTKKEK